MGLNLNYSGTTRFVDTADVLTDDFGYTGDIAFIIEESEVDGTPVITYEASTSETTGALEVVADNADPFDDTTEVKLATVIETLATAKVGDFVKKITTTPKVKTTVNSGAYVKYKTGWVAINLD
jgi:hypothetical protein